MPCAATRRHDHWRPPARSTRPPTRSSPARYWSSSARSGSSGEVDGLRRRHGRQPDHRGRQHAVRDAGSVHPIGGRPRSRPACGLAAAVPGARRARSAAFPGANGKIAYVSGAAGIWTMNPDGIAALVRTSKRPPRSELESRRHGRRTARESRSRRRSAGNDQDVWTMNADGDGTDRFEREPHRRMQADGIRTAWSPRRHVRSRSLVTDGADCPPTRVMFRESRDGTGFTKVPRSAATTTPGLVARRRSDRLSRTPRCRNCQFRALYVVEPDGSGDQPLPSDGLGRQAALVARCAATRSLTGQSAPTFADVRAAHTDQARRHRPTAFRAGARIPPGPGRHEDRRYDARQRHHLHDEHRRLRRPVADSPSGHGARLAADPARLRSPQVGFALLRLAGPGL